MVCFAQSLNADGVTISTVSPEVIATPKIVEMAKTQGMGETSEEIDASFAKMIKPPPLVRMGRVEDVANVVVCFVYAKFGPLMIFLIFLKRWSVYNKISQVIENKMVGDTGFEPVTSTVCKRHKKMKKRKK